MDVFAVGSFAIGIVLGGVSLFDSWAATCNPIAARTLSLTVVQGKVNDIKRFILRLGDNVE